MAVSLRAWSADALVCSGYKWLSTHGGVALLAVDDTLLEGVPELVGWKGSEHPFRFDPTTLALASDARRFELSTIAYSLAAGGPTSIELLTRVGRDALAAHAEALARELVAATEPHGWAPFRDLDTPSASHHIVSLRHPTLSAAAVQARLADERRIVVSARGGGIRVSLHVYNDSEDIAVLANALAETARESPSLARRADLRWHGSSSQGSPTRSRSAPSIPP